MTNAGFGDAGLDSAWALLLVLIRTFSAIGLGFVSVRYGSIDPQRGDMTAVQFFVGRIALPLTVFRIVATANIGSIDVGVIFACSLAKISVYLLTSAMSLCAYRSKDPMNKRLLTSAVFGFFSTASNDLAIGFPVIQAIYGDEMMVYLAANVLVFQTVIQPGAMIMFEVSQMFKSGPDVRIDSTMWSRLARSIALNPIMLATAFGVFYSTALASTLRIGADGKLELPEPISSIIALWTSPFQMLFLFTNGTALRSASVTLWPVILVLMKVVVCAYISYGLSHVFVNPEHDQAQALREFTFFYGTIPAGGAPLIYAQLLDCGVDVIAAASIFALVLAGPIEFMTALFLGTEDSPVNYDDVRIVLHRCSQASAMCSGMFVIFVLLGWWGGSFASRAIGVFGVVTLLYEVLTLSVMSDTSPVCIDSQWVPKLYCFFQNICYILVVYIEYHMGTRWKEGRRARSHVVTCVVLVLAFVVALVVPTGNGLHEMCGMPMTPASAVYLVGWNATLLVVMTGLAMRGRMLKQRVGGQLPLRPPRSTPDLLKLSKITRPLLTNFAPSPTKRVSKSGGKETFGGQPHARFEETLPPTHIIQEPASSSIDDAVDENAFSKERQRDVGADADEHAASKELQREVGGDGVAVANCLIVLQGLRSLMGVINCTAQVFSKRGVVNRDGFTPMLILEDILEHGQGCFVLLAVVFQPGVLASTRSLFVGLAARGCCQAYWPVREEPEFDAEPETPFPSTSYYSETVMFKMPSRVSSSILDQLG